MSHFVQTSIIYRKCKLPKLTILGDAVMEDEVSLKVGFGVAGPMC